jgi:glycyl-tRNA synthetase beta subunit
MSNHPPVNDFLVEIGTEELPPKALKHLLKSFFQHAVSRVRCRWFSA